MMFRHCGWYALVIFMMVAATVNPAMTLMKGDAIRGLAVDTLRWPCYSMEIAFLSQVKHSSRRIEKCVS
jgi:hypothetical protein